MEIGQGGLALCCGQSQLFKVRASIIPTLFFLADYHSLFLCFYPGVRGLYVPIDC
jgi:hypothetical protein